VLRKLEENKKEEGEDFIKVFIDGAQKKESIDYAQL
jgi:hypothetical protein